VIAEGPPETIAATEASYTGKFLAHLLPAPSVVARRKRA
jgi:hypothetical protein